MKILIACEESQAVCTEFRKLGHEAFSCDILPASGNNPEWHIQKDVFEVINEGWDIMIAFPPCTYLSVSGAQWYYHPDDKHLPNNERRPHPKYPNRTNDQADAADFFIKLYNSNIPKVCIENPVGIMSSKFRKPDQVIQPWMFGDEATKTTCLWLKNLPQLLPSEIVSKGERTIFKSGKSHPKWYADALAKAKTPEERRNLRSKTFPGIAKAMAIQWNNQ
jgi:site-specific DNA-cytosine methylase